MNWTMPKVERFLLLIGLLISLISAYLFFVKSEELARFLGLVSETSRDVVAKAEVVHELVKRKSFDSPEFQNVTVNQSVFSKDTIMTGKTSGLVLSFMDGSVVELGPDTLVQIDAHSSSGQSDFELTLDVQKGQVSGTSAGKQIQVKQNGEVKAIAPVATQSLASFLTTPQKKEALSSCHIRSSRVIPPSPDEDQLPSIEVTVGCGAGITKSDLLVKNPQGALLSTIPIEISPDYTGRIEFLATGPGQYSLELKQEIPEKVSLNVPKEYELMSWAQDDLRCDLGVQWVPSHFKIKGYSLVDSSGKVVRQSSRPSDDHFSRLNEVKLPNQMMVHASLVGSDFWIRTRARPVQEWKICPLLKLPADGTTVRLAGQPDVLFTWNFLSHEDLFVFEIATDAEFKNKVLSQRTDQNFIRARLPHRGRYYWKVEELHRHSLSDKFEFDLVP